ncbi:MAG: protein-L-isoaspartate(D-aspartate) O-methyltransferase [Acidobacteria bacterium]|nr:MAG: protein-L-isoaspartate(D-aspartate) O-methyltransferase [Acidobacteriota bacterium]
MVDRQVKKRGVKAPRLLSAMEEVPRHLFVPQEQRERAYDDAPVRIGRNQLLPQAYLSARMIELLELDGDEKVLEIGTGSGYDAALLSRVAREVHTIEIDEDLGRQARRTLRQLGYDNVTVHIGDGYRGLPEEAPFDAILLTTAPEELPEPLFEQLKEGGKIVAPIGTLVQKLQVITKTADGRQVRNLIPVRLGRMTGEIEEQRR